MASYRTSNPIFNQKIIGKFGQKASQASMTVNGAIHKSLLLILFVILAASWIWHIAIKNPAALPNWMMAGVIAGVVFALITIFKQDWAPYLSPLYALSEGVVIGGLSIYAESFFPGIVLQAVTLTFGVLIVLLVLYRGGIIQATNQFKAGVLAAIGAIALIYLLSFILSFFGISMPFIHTTGWVGIGFSAGVVVIAALNLVIDFDTIETAARENSPKYMEWYCAFGLMVTMIWLYIEILNLLLKIRGRK